MGHLNSRKKWRVRRRNSHSWGRGVQEAFLVPIQAFSLAAALAFSGASLGITFYILWLLSFKKKKKV